MPEETGSGTAVLGACNGGLLVQEKERRSLSPLSGRLLPDYSDDIFPAELNLAEMLMDGEKWPVRNQHHRNTCIAFCAAAFVELREYLKTGSLPISDVSEEFLYAMISAVDYDDVISDITHEEMAHYDETGGRFLAQARCALVRGALVPEADLPYNAEAAIQVGHVTEPDAALLEKAKSSAIEGLTNMIAKKKADALVVGPDRLWAKDKADHGQTLEVTRTFLKLLQDGKPVLAGFPLLRGWMREIWFGGKVFETGVVRYPRPSELQDLRIAGGHSICIVGYTTRFSEESNGYFIFRNSLGRNFGWLRSDNSGAVRPPAKGYGLISFDDVEHYCLEFMYA